MILHTVIHRSKQLWREFVLLVGYIAAAINGGLHWEVPRLDRWGLYLPAAFIFCCYAYWRLFAIYPGYSISALALAAVIIAVRADRFTPGERVIWVLISAVLMVAEIRVTYLDRAQSDTQQARERAEQQARFDKTVEKFNEVGKQNEAAISELLRANSIAEKTLGNVTGGDSFVFMQRVWGDRQSPETTVGPYWVAESHGDSNLHGVNARVLDLDKVDAFMKANPKPTVDQVQQLYLELPLGDFAAPSSRFLTLPQLKLIEPHLNIFFSGLNGFWIENYTCRVITGRTLCALRVARQRGSKEEVVLETIAPGFPVNSTGKPLGNDSKPLW